MLILVPSPFGAATYVLHLCFIKKFNCSLNSRHPALNDLQSTLENSYNAESPHSIGSQLLTSTLKRQCQVNFIKELLYKDCTKSAWVMPVEMTCSFPERRGSYIFNSARKDVVIKKLRDTDSISLKLWSSQSPTSWGSDKSQTAFYKLAQALCPIVHGKLESGQY